MQLSAACSVLERFLGRFPSFGTSCNFSKCASVSAVAQFGNGREDFSSPAIALSGLTSFPELPQIPDHTFYMVTPSGDGGTAFSAAVHDVLDRSAWFVAAYSTSEKAVEHLHYLVALPSYVDEWLLRWPTVKRNFRDLPCVDCSIRDDHCNLVYSKITNVDGLAEYLCGPKNFAKFYTFIDNSPRAVWEPNYHNRSQEFKKEHFGTSTILSLEKTSQYSCKSLNLQERPEKGKRVLVIHFQKPTEARQPRLTGFQNIVPSKGDPPETAIYCSGYI